MRMLRTLFLVAAASAACVATSAYAATVSTADGLYGSDAEFREARGVDGIPDPIGGAAANNDRLNARTQYTEADPLGSRNDIIGLKFDLTGYILADMTGVTLNLINHRNNGSRHLALYGVAQGTVSGSGSFTTETWMDTDVTVFGDLPGLLASDNIPATQSLNLAALTHLGSLTPAAPVEEGTVVTFSDPAIDSFLQGYAGSQFVTFIIAFTPDYVSNGQMRFASREATSLNAGIPTGAAGDFAPYLEFTLIPEPTSLALFGLGSLVLLLRRKR